MGEATVLLPKDDGVLVNGAGGPGSLQTTRYHRQSEIYENDANSNSEQMIDLEIIGAIGTIELETIE